MARQNVETVFEAWLVRKSKTVGPMATDGTTITSYAMPLLTRQGSRVFLAKKAKGAYSVTTAQHLSGLHQLVTDPLSPVTRGIIGKMEVLQVDASDVKIAARGGDDADEVVIKYVDLPGGRFKGNPTRRNPVGDPAEEVRRLLLDPDPAAMAVAEDIIIDNGLSLRTLTEQWLRRLRIRWTGAAVAAFLRIEAGVEDPELPNELSYVRAAGLIPLGVEVGEPAPGEHLWVQWAVNAIGTGRYEVEYIIDFLGVRPLGDMLPYTYATSSSTHYKSLAHAAEDGARSAWDIAKVLKRRADPFMTDGGDHKEVEDIFKDVNTALVDPRREKTAPAVYGRKAFRPAQKRSRFEKYHKNPGVPVDPQQHCCAECNRPMDCNNVGPGMRRCGVDPEDHVCDSCVDADGNPIKRRLDALKANPQDTGAPTRVPRAWYLVSFRDELGRQCQGREEGRNAAEARQSLLSKFPHFQVTGVRQMAADEARGWYPSDDPRTIAFNEQERLHRLRKNPGISQGSQQRIVCEKCRADLQPVGWEDGVQVWASEDGTRCGARGRHSAINHMHLRKNPGELDAVRSHFESKIEEGAQHVLEEYVTNHRDFGTKKSATTAARQGQELLFEAVQKSEDVSSVADLFALAMQIDTGEEFEWVMPPKRPRPQLLLDSARGTTIPQAFAEQIKREYVTGLSPSDWLILESGGEEPEELLPDENLSQADIDELADIDWDSAYWEVWDMVTTHGSVKVTEPKGQVWTVDVTENGDVFLVPEGMRQADPDDDADEYWVWEDEEENPAHLFGASLAHMALRDAHGSWFGDHKQQSDDGRMRWEPAIPRLDGRLVDGKFTWTLDETPTTRHLVRVTFEEVTPGADDGAEQEVETGWDNEEGWNVDDDRRDDESVAQATARFIRHEVGSVEPSSSPGFHKGVWYSQIDADENYQTGVRRSRSFHLDGYTEAEEREVFDLLTKKR